MKIWVPKCSRTMFTHCEKRQPFETEYSSKPQILWHSCDDFPTHPACLDFARSVIKIPLGWCSWQNAQEELEFEVKFGYVSHLSLLCGLIIISPDRTLATVDFIMINDLQLLVCFPSDGDGRAPAKCLQSDGDGRAPERNSTMEWNSSISHRSVPFYPKWAVLITRLDLWVIQHISCLRTE
jgi:hypothetical protein